MRGHWIVAMFVFLAMAGCAVASGEGVAKEEEALDALDAFSKSARLDPGEVVLGMVGFYGQPQPVQWLILTGKPGGPLRESVVARGRVLAERKFSPLPGQDLPHLPLVRETLKLSSARAFRIAETRARSRRTAFDSAHFQLRVRDEGAEPVWMLSLLNSAQVSVGIVYVSAHSGEILRETWTHPPRPDDAKVSAR